MTGLGTSQRRSADDGGAPEHGRNTVAGTPAELSAVAAGDLLGPRPAGRPGQGVAAGLTPAALWRNHRLFTIVACVSLIPRVIAALGFKPALLIQDSFSYLAEAST